MSASARPPTSTCFSRRSEPRAAEAPRPSPRPRRLVARVGTVPRDRLGDPAGLNLASSRKRGERGDRDVMTVDLEERAQSRARIAATEAVRSKRGERAVDIGGDQLGIGANVIGRGDDGSVTRQAMREMAADGIGGRIEPVVAFRRAGVAGKLRIAGDAPYFGGDSPVRLEHAGGFDDLAENGPRAKQANAP